MIVFSITIIIAIVSEQTKNAKLGSKNFLNIYVYYHIGFKSNFNQQYIYTRKIYIIYQVSLSMKSDRLWQ